MKQRKKQLLGVLGLLAVMAMTVLASLLPAGNAAAEGEPAGPTTTIQVRVEASTDPDNPGPGGPSSSVPYVQFVTPVDGATVTRNEVTVTADYRNATSVKYILRRADAGSTSDDIVVYEETFEGKESGTNNFVLRMNEYANKFDEGFVLVAEISTESGSIVSDAVKFTYRAVYVEMAKEPAKNDDPIANVQFNEEVTKLVFQVYDKSGKPVFVNNNGVEEPLIFTGDQLDHDKLALDVVLPMEKYGAKPGDYQLVVLAYNEAGETISMNLTDFQYRPDWIKNPNTGSVLVDTNISRTDYLLTGLIIFGSVAAFAGFLIFRKKRQL